MTNKSNRCAKFGISQDQFGHKVQIFFKGSATYGTVVGGYVSLFAGLVIWMLALGQIWACFF